MVNTQGWFDKEHSKEEKKIKLKGEKFQGQLVVENFSGLEKLYLRDIKSIDKVTLKNLDQLQECTIWNCGTQDLVIENCLQLKKLNIRSNLLTSLEFMKDLENLEEFEIDNNTEVSSGLEYLPSSLKKFSCDNTQLIEILKPYQGDWKAYWIIELAKQNPQKLLRTISYLREQNKRLKKEIKEYNNSPQSIILNDVDFEKKYQSLKKTLNLLLKEEQLKTVEISRLELEKTKTIYNIATVNIIEKIKEQKNSLSNLKKINQELQKKLDSFEHSCQITKKNIEQKEKELSDLITDINNELDESKREELTELLDSQEEMTKNDNEKTARRLKLNKKRLVEIINEEKVNNLCQLQIKIIQLKLELQKNLNHQEQQIHQTITNINIQRGHAIIGSSFGDNNNLSQIQVRDNTFANNQGSIVVGVGEIGDNTDLSSQNIIYQEQELQAQIQQPTKSN